MTDFADQAVVLPVAIAVGAALLAARAWRSAAAWAAVVGASFGLTLLLKLVLRACGSPVPEVALHSPSGHAAAGTAVYGGLLVLLGAGAWAGTAAAAAIAVLIGWSRLALGAHTLPEAVAGGLIGVASVFALALFADRAPGPRPAGPGRAGVVLAALTLVLLLHGQRLRAEPFIRGLAESYVRAALGCGAEQRAGRAPDGRAPWSS